MNEDSKVRKESVKTSTHKLKPAEDCCYHDREGMRISVIDKAKYDFSDHPDDEKKHTCLIAKVSLTTKVLVEELGGSNAEVSFRVSLRKGSQQVKLNQLVGHYDSEK